MKDRNYIWVVERKDPRGIWQADETWFERKYALDSYRYWKTRNGQYRVRKYVREEKRG